MRLARRARCGLLEACPRPLPQHRSKVLLRYAGTSAAPQAMCASPPLEDDVAEDAFLAFEKSLDKYQEMAQLLDTHLESLPVLLRGRICPKRECGRL